jgi:ABC-type transport system involved in cytochrome bd biosynthesis fused ATPase/permease subunit
MKLSKAIAIRQVQFGLPRLILETSIILGGLVSGVLIWYTLSIAQGLVVLSSLMIIGIRLQPAILKIQNGIQVMLQHKESSSAAHEVLSFYQPLYSQGDKAELFDSPVNSGKLVVKNLGYKFADGHLLFKDVNFEFSETGIYLVKGNNGIGKTTIFEIISGLREPFEGSIEFRGINLLEIPQEMLGEFLSYLPQKPHFYNQTIADSLMLDETSSILDNERFKECLRILEVLQFDLVKHELFTKFNLAEYLSEGEKAKLSLVRTFIRQSDILLLDEPTAALDPNSRIAVRDFLELESKKRLVLVISHDNLFDEIASGEWEI